MRVRALALVLASALRLAWPMASAAGISTLDAIDAGLAEGRIDRETALVYRALAVLDPSRLPPEYQGAPQVIKSATPIMLEVMDAWEHLSPPARLALAEHVQYRTPLAHSYASPSGHFRLHYDIAGAHAVNSSDSNGDTVPDYVEEAAAIFDSVWAREVDQMGYNAPPSDGTQGGGSQYDVYIIDFAEAVYGYTIPEGTQDGKTTSYIQVDNDYLESLYPTRGLDGLRVTAAHEFFHAIQFGYCGDRNDLRWWMEICATWVEDVVYNDVNDYYNYLGAFFDSPGSSLDRMNSSRDYYPYGAALFAHYLEHRFGQETIRTIWEGLDAAGSYDLGVFDEALRPTGLEAAVQEFAVWCYFTGSRARPGLFFPEAAYYPEMVISRTHSAYPVEGEALSVDHLGSKYVRFVPRPGPGDLIVGLSPADRTAWGWQIITQDRGEVEVLPIEGWTARIEDWSQYDDLVAVPTVTQWQGRYYAAYYTARVETDTTQPLVAALGQNFPNPFALGKVSNPTVIPFDLAERAEVRVTIYSTTGQKVRRFELGSLSPASYDDLEWDGKDAQGRSVAAGVYFYEIVAGRFRDIQRMVVLRAR